ncbi:MAG: hypothetical protein U9N60_12070 [Thermodesulfobacteriota bacterium]|nr:hypothetical protein [Thermodesulfobacteriota bacterium]
MPIDEWLAPRLIVRRTDSRLYDFLKIEHKQPSILNLLQPTQDPQSVLTQINWKFLKVLNDTPL